MFKKQRYLTTFQSQNLTQEGLNLPLLKENSAEFSLFHWRSSNAFLFLAYRPRFFGPYTMEEQDVTEASSLYFFYMLQLRLYYMLRKQNKIGWYTGFTQLRWGRFFDFLTIHNVFLIEIWARPFGYLDVWTNEEEFLYSTINLFYFHLYDWSLLKKLLNFSFPFLSDFSSFFSLNGPSFVINNF